MSLIVNTLRSLLQELVASLFLEVLLQISNSRCPSIRVIDKEADEGQQGLQYST
jgi:hypothetical protein